MDLITIFYHTDNFCKLFEKQMKTKFLTSGQSKRNRKFKLCLSEIMTIMIHYHYSGYKTFKDYYCKHVLTSLKSDFPNLVSYNRFLELKQKTILPMTLFIKLSNFNQCTGTSFIDSFCVKASHIRRASSHKTLKGIAKKGKTSVGWFYGLKVHLSINQHGDLINFCITSGNVVDNNHNVITRLTNNMFGKIYGDKGYLLSKKMITKLQAKNINFITKVRRNMKRKAMNLQDQFILRKRGIIESVISILKEQFSIEHTRHRSLANFLTHICSALAAYVFREKKPSIDINCSTSITST